MSECKHETLVEGYYGHNCAACGELVYPYGSEPWMPDDSDYPAAGRGDGWDDDEFDSWLDQCGWVRGQGCQLAGTEECDFDCPFRDDNYKGLRLTRARLAKRKAAKG